MPPEDFYHTAAAVLQLVNMDQPPLRPMLGAHVRDLVTTQDGDRVDEWSYYRAMTDDAQSPRPGGAVWGSHGGRRPVADDGAVGGWLRLKVREMQTMQEQPGRDEVLALYDAVGWAVYTREPGTLLRALAGSHLVLTARDDDESLVGLVRTISDDATICYIQDLLVDPAAQRTGVGSALFRAVLARYAHCRMVVLSTDRADAPAAAASPPLLPRDGPGAVRRE